MFVVEFVKRFEVYSSLILCFLVLLRQYGASEKEEMPAIVGVDYEVYGKVQGVFFRMHTQSEAKKLGLKGWCMNTEQGTVVGYMEGDKHKVDAMKHWLQYTGSPNSEIDKAVFRNEKELEATTFEDFTFKKK